VVEIIPDKISKAFFVTSVILNNEPFFSFLPVEVQEKYRQIAASRADKSIPPNLDRVRQTLFNGSKDSKELTAFLYKLEPQPIQPYEDTVDLTSFSDTTVPVVYVICKNDISLPTKTFNKMISLLPKSAQIVKIDADHEAMFSNPKAVADLLLRQA
jgi:pimeloyl-ACP methyl ester carboxylesterase